MWAGRLYSSSDYSPPVDPWEDICSQDFFKGFSRKYRFIYKMALETHGAQITSDAPPRLPTAITNACPFSITLSLLEKADLFSLPYRLREKAMSLFLATGVHQILANRFWGMPSQDSHIPSLWVLRFMARLFGRASVGTRHWDLQMFPWGSVSPSSSCVTVIFSQSVIPWALTFQ